MVLLEGERGDAQHKVVRTHHFSTPCSRQTMSSSAISILQWLPIMASFDQPACSPTFTARGITSGSGFDSTLAAVIDGCSNHATTQSVLLEVLQLQLGDDGDVARVLLGNDVAEVLQAPVRV